MTPEALFLNTKPIAWRGCRAINSDMLVREVFKWGIAREREAGADGEAFDEMICSPKKR